MLKTLPISSSIFDKNLNGTHKRNPSSNIPKDISVNNIFLTGNDPSPKYQCTTHKKVLHLFVQIAIKIYVLFVKKIIEITNYIHIELLFLMKKKLIL